MKKHNFTSTLGHASKFGSFSRVKQQCCLIVMQLIRFKNNMDYSIPTKSVTIKKGSLIVITDLNRIDDNAYYTMVPSVCLDLNEYPEIAKQLKEVVFLNKWGKQGWTTIEMEKVDIKVFIAALTCAYCEVAPKKLATLVLSKEEEEQ